jgi:hypothetical protein
MVVAANRYPPHDRNIADQMGAATDSGSRPHNAKWADFDILFDFGSRIDSRLFGDKSGHGVLFLIIITCSKYIGL